MGGRISTDFINTSGLSDEIAESLNQIVRAFNQEFQLDSERWKDRHHHHQHIHPIASTSSMQTDVSIKPSSHHRSYSADGYQPDEHLRSSKHKSSTIKRQWQCQFCHKINEGDILICSECGSNKINVYIPIMDREPPATFPSPTVPAIPARYELKCSLK